MGDLTTHFSRHEFTCRCGCGFDEIQPEFVERLQEARDRFGPMIVHSGCRCADHNRQEGGRPRSAHLQGWAADLRCTDSFSRYRLVRALLDTGFERLGLGETFVHVDADPHKTARLIWMYPPASNIRNIFSKE